jgi:hypothetical protein
MPAPTYRPAPRFVSRSPLPRNPALAVAVLGATTALHLLPWLLWPPAAAPGPDSPPTVRVAVLKLQTAPQRELEAPAPGTPARADARRPARRALEPPRRDAEDAEAAATPGGPTAAAPPASAPGVPAPQLDLDGAAARRAVRDVARSPSMADLGDLAQGSDRRLGEAIAAGARGDCLKGEYVGGGMGLLSLPFLAIAKLRDECSK